MGAKVLGYRDVKARVLSCLRTGSVSHEARGSIDTKNLLATGQVTLDKVAEVIGRSRGGDYTCSPHHQVDGVEVHLIKTVHQGRSWYIKWYFADPNTVFISVHE